MERTYGRLMPHRRLALDYETLPARSEAVIPPAMPDLMARRLTGESAVSPARFDITGPPPHRRMEQRETTTPKRRC